MMNKMVKQTLTNIRSIKHMTFGLILIILILNHQPIGVGTSDSGLVFWTLAGQLLMTDLRQMRLEASQL